MLYALSPTLKYNIDQNPSFTFQYVADPPLYVADPNNTLQSLPNMLQTFGIMLQTLNSTIQYVADPQFHFTICCRTSPSTLQ